MLRAWGVVVLLLTAAPVGAQMSPPVTITVTSPAALAPIRITFPLDGTATYKVGETLTLRAVAPAGTGVLEFFSNGIRLGESAGPDYALTVRIGTLGVKRFTVAPKLKPVAGVRPIWPVVLGTVPAAMAEGDGMLLVVPQARVGDAPAGVEFRLNGTRLWTDWAPPYEMVWLAPKGPVVFSACILRPVPSPVPWTWPGDQPCTTGVILN